MHIIQPLQKACRSIFPVVSYAWTTIPTYPSGQMGFMVCCKDANTNVKKPARSVSEEEEQRLFMYYSKEIHEAAFVMPNFVKKGLKGEVNYEKK